MALATMIENLKQAREAYEKQLESLGKDAQKVVCESLAPLIPEGKLLVWAAYTDYFNDGEACTFSVHTPSLRSGTDLKEIRRAYHNNDEEQYSTDLGKMFRTLPTDMMKSAFGDHVLVAVAPSGEFRIVEYTEHD